MSEEPEIPPTEVQSTSGKKPKTLRDRLTPHQKLIQRVQEILFFKQKIALVAIVFIVISVFSFAKESESGFFASIALIFAVFYGLRIFWQFAGSKIEPFLFKELPPEDKSVTNRVRSFDEVLDIIEHCSCCKNKGESKEDKPANSTQRIIAAVVCFVVAFFLKFVNIFYLNLILTLLVLFLPGILVHPSVYPKIFKNKQ